jgi:hypothetical protein
MDEKDLSSQRYLEHESVIICGLEVDIRGDTLTMLVSHLIGFD